MSKKRSNIRFPRVVNKRILPISALVVTATILLRYCTGVDFVAGVVLRVLFAAGLSVAGVVCFVRRKRAIAVLLFVLLGTSVVTGACYDIRLKTYHSFMPVSGNTYLVCGVVDTLVTQNGNVQAVTLSSPTVDEKKVNGKVRLYFEDELSAHDVKQGDRVEASGFVYAIKPIDGASVDSVSFRKDIRYKMFVASDGIAVSAQKPKGLAAVRSRLYDRLLAAMGERFGTVAYAMLTGDKSELNETSARLYSLSGIGHILAVSGLHIGLLAAVLLFLLEKCRLPRTVRVGVTMGILLLYAAFVGFTASVVRAVIMCGVMMAAHLVGERKDTLSSMSLAYCLILIVSPFSLFEVGFLMSFAAVFGLTLFYNPFYAALRKIHLPKFLSSPFAATTAVQVGVIPITGYFFAQIPTYAILFNLLLIPVLTVTFVLLVCLLPFILLFSATTLLRLTGLGLAFVDLVAGIVPALPLHTIPVLSHKALFLLFPLYFAASRFLLVPTGKGAKRLTSAGLALCCALVAVVPTAVSLRPDKRLQNAVIPVDAYGDVTTVFVRDAVTVVGDVQSPVALKKALQTFNLRFVDTIVLHRLTEETGRALYEFTQDVSVGRIVCPLSTAQPAGVAALGRYRRFYLLEETELPFLTQVTEGSKHLGYVYEFSDTVRVLAMSKFADYRKVPDTVLARTPIVRCSLYLNAFGDRVYLTSLPRGCLGETPPYQYSTADDGLFAYKVFSGELFKKS